MRWHVEAGGAKHALEQRQCAAFDGRHAFAADQRLGERDGDRMRSSCRLLGSCEGIGTVAVGTAVPRMNPLSTNANR